MKQVKLNTEYGYTMRDGKIIDRFILPVGTHKFPDDVEVVQLESESEVYATTPCLDDSKSLQRMNYLQQLNSLDARLVRPLADFITTGDSQSRDIIDTLVAEKTVIRQKLNELSQV